MSEYVRGEWEDIGSDVLIRRVTLDDDLVGIDWNHTNNPACNQRELYVPFGAKRGYVATSEDPLTLNKALTCPFCSLSGSVTDGLWVPDDGAGAAAAARARPDNAHMKK